MNVQAAAAVEARTDRLVELLGERELDCLLVTDLFNVRYLTGFTGTNGACVVTPEERLFLTDFRYVEQAAEQVRGYEAVQVGRDMAGDMASRLRGRAGFDDEHVSVALHGKLADKAAEAVELVGAGGLVERLRAVKDESEVAAMRAAAELATEAYETLLEGGLAGRTEREVAIGLVRFMEDGGAEGASFEPIVASGAHGALPHAVPRDEVIPEDTLVVVDLGAKVDGYCSDCTRTIATGPLDDTAGEVYELVLRAQQEALGAVRAGAGCAAVDAVARDVIEAAGHGERFGHGLGHGVGLEVHEAPRLGKTAEGDLETGNAVTVEPGVYLPGVVGVRIEDLVIVTEGEPEILTSFPKDLVTG
ncbi:MAG TPA: Xaa-Pro peptidase family protein [Thermoleophilaceae bacterium]|jgi:Xaa-Pro aminopeptidase|nr:Xaa-Pro peptidase family protein [Thermoleophilaceae bacterium]